jgi:hypothetical protein
MKVKSEKEENGAVSFVSIIKVYRTGRELGVDCLYFIIMGSRIILGRELLEDFCYVGLDKVHSSVNITEEYTKLSEIYY